MLSQEKQKKELLEKDLHGCKQEIQNYSVDLSELNKVVRELEGMKIKITQKHAKKVEELEHKSECAIKWCGATDQHVQVSSCSQLILLRTGMNGMLRI